MTDLQIQQRISSANAEILRALQALRHGDFGFRMSLEADGAGGKIAALFNEIAEMNAALVAELGDVCDRLGKRQTRPNQRRASFPGAAGSWAKSLDSINRILNEFAARNAEGSEELRNANAQLRQQALELSGQVQEAQRHSARIEAARLALEQKAEQLLMSSRYKSEFLANMSHELRTPLNSLLILAQLLSENASGNLTPKQVEYAQTICISGNDLLALINDILDLSKIESGTVTLNIAEESLAELRDQIERAFRQVAQDKGLAFDIAMDGALPSALRTDMKRLRQILQNLLANAFKFTLKGSVSLRIATATGGWTPGHPSLDAAQDVVAFSVIDTGIGVAADKQRLIFEAFRQADGTTSRQFEGTGLGLSISSELARLLGGEIRIQSELGKGSEFTLYLPAAYQYETGADVLEEIATADDAVNPPDDVRATQPPAAEMPPDPTDEQDDRGSIRPGDRVVLIVMETDSFATMLLRQVRELGFKGVRAANAHTALALANEFMPNVVNVEISQRNMSGWALHNLLRHDPDTRHIPVNMISIDYLQQTCACMSALGIVATPTRKETLREALRLVQGELGRVPANVLVAAAGKAERKRIMDAIASDSVHAIGVGTASQALKTLSRTGVDCAILGRNLADLTAFVRDVVHVDSIRQTFLVLQGFTEDEGPAGEGVHREMAEVLWLKHVPSADAVLQETARCLQLAIQEMPPGRRRPLPSMRQTVPALSGRKVLVVDDDIRNIFALTGALEHQGMVVLNAESGREAIESLRANPDVDVVLMDIMMPEQDGYQTIGAIRSIESFSAVPIIGVTAKAMKGDREKCIEAGATDYISKPINMEMLLSLMRMWIADKDPAASN